MCVHVYMCACVYVYKYFHIFIYIYIYIYIFHVCMCVRVCLCVCEGQDEHVIWILQGIGVLRISQISKRDTCLRFTFGILVILLFVSSAWYDDKVTYRVTPHHSQVQVRLCVESAFGCLFLQLQVSWTLWFL